MLTTRLEAHDECGKPVLYEDVTEHHPAVTRGIMIRKLGLGCRHEELLIGIDPGQLTGLSAFYCGREIESSVYSSVDGLVAHIVQILGGLRAGRKIVKIGNGNMAVASQIATTLNLKFCSAFELEFVDERRTSRKTKHFNQRGKRDMLSARYITMREGFRRSVMPLSITG